MHEFADSGNTPPSDQSQGKERRKKKEVPNKRPEWIGALAKNENDADSDYNSEDDAKQDKWTGTATAGTGEQKDTKTDDGKGR